MAAIGQWSSFSVIAATFIHLISSLKILDLSKLKLDDMGQTGTKIKF
jgi:hypothetical protein